MKRWTAITLIVLAPGLLTFAIALGCFSNMPACHMSGHAHPCCAKNAAAGHNTAVRYAAYEVAPPAADAGTAEPIAAAVAVARTTDALSFASPPRSPLRV